MDGSDDLALGRDRYAASAWTEAYEALSRADRVASLEADDLERLARAAYMLGLDDRYVDGLERAHRLHAEAGRVAAAVACAFWIGHNLLFRGEPTKASGWFARGSRLLESGDEESVERGYLLFPEMLRELASGEFDAAQATLAETLRVGEQFGDADLVWLTRDEQARAMMLEGRVADARRVLDEVLVATTEGEMSPIVSGIVYCNTIIFCRDAFELRRARDWTEALTRWCDAQPQMVAHNGLCLVHQAEVTQLSGAWEDALDQSRVAAERFQSGVLNRVAVGKAHYRQGEIHRLRGALELAEAAYREASRWGHDPQPGLAMLRRALGNTEAAAAAIRRAVGERRLPLERAALLPAYVEIMLGAGELDSARAACGELDEIAELRGSEVLRALADEARGAVGLADGAPDAALDALRRAGRVWDELGAPYEIARLRVLIGLACGSLGDSDTCRLELDMARETFVALGAAPDVARIDSLDPAPPADAHALTGRELEVLRLVAAGQSNREIAATLVISEHTVARHVQNIFAKLGVGSRTAAGAVAFARGLA